MEHNDLIKALGGPAKLARDLGLNRGRVARWAFQGVAWKFRPAVAAVANDRGVELPDGFLDWKDEQAAS